jgi:putative membrane protein
LRDIVGRVETEGAMATETTEVSTNPPERKGFYVRGWILAVVAVVIVAAAAVAIGFAMNDGGDGDRRGFGRGGGFGGRHGDGGHGLGIILLLILIALAIAGAVLVARRYAARAKETGSSAEEILAERFARGEIEEADYLSRRNALRS